MKVLLKRPWFVGGRRHRKSIPSASPVEVPDEYKDILPPGAVLVTKETKEEKVEKKEPSLHEADSERVAAEAEATVWNELNKQDAGSAMEKRALELEAAEKKKQGRPSKK